MDFWKVTYIGLQSESAIMYSQFIFRKSRQGASTNCKWVGNGSKKSGRWGNLPTPRITPSPSRVFAVRVNWTVDKLSIKRIKYSYDRLHRRRGSSSTIFVSLALHGLDGPALASALASRVQALALALASRVQALALALSVPALALALALMVQALAFKFWP